jgi:hypothetical protein
VLSHCNQFWEGQQKSIWQLTKKDRTFLSNLYNRWSHEGFQCQAVSYRPLLPVDHPLTNGKVDGKSGGGNENHTDKSKIPVDRTEVAASLPSSTTIASRGAVAVSTSTARSSIRSFGGLSVVPPTFSSVPSRLLVMPQESTHLAFEGVHFDEEEKSGLTSHVFTKKMIVMMVMVVVMIV